MSWGTRLVQMSLVLLAVAAPRIAAADDKSKWEFEAQSYGWVAGNYGSVTVKGHTADISVTPVDLYHLLEDGNAFAGAGYFALSYDRFSVFADSMGGYAEESVNETVPTKFCTLSLRARDKIKFVVTDFALAYRLGQWSLPYARRPFTLGVYAGTRYMYFGNQLNASGNFRGDIGGFGASSDLIWGLLGTVRFWVPWTPVASVHPYLDLGYRGIAFDRSKEAGSIDMQLRGPLAGAGFVC